MGNNHSVTRETLFFVRSTVYHVLNSDVRVSLHTPCYPPLANCKIVVLLHHSLTRLPKVTGIVADLLRNKRSIPYARAWRSDINMLSVTQLMVRLWVAEEARLGVSRPNGVLQNVWQPLQSHDRGSRRRRWIAQSAKRDRSVMPTNGASMDPIMTTSEHDTALGARESGLDASCVILEPGDSAEVTPGATADSVVADLAAVTSEFDGVSETARISQNSSETPSAMTLSLQTGKRGVGTGQSGERGKEANASHVDVDSLYSKAMGHLDLRGKIAAVMEMVGLDGGATDGLGPSDLKASYMASTYMNFRVGEAWQEVSECLPHPLHNRAYFFSAWCFVYDWRDSTAI